MNDEMYWNVIATHKGGLLPNEVREAYGEHANHEFDETWNMAWREDEVPEIWKAAWKIVEIGGYIEFQDEHGIIWEMEEWS